VTDGRPVVGFVGLGAMGARMAARLVQSGYRLVVYNRSPGPAEAMRRLGAIVAVTPADLARAADIVCGCLLDGSAVEHVYAGEDGLLGASREGHIFVEHGTFAPALAQRLAESCARRGASFRDAPVTGGPEGAAAGTLTAMVGGASAAVARATPVISCYAGRVRHAGGSGAGLQLKLVNQLLVSVHVAAAAEGSALLRRLGLPLDVAVDVLTSGWAASPMLERSLQRIRSGELDESDATIGGLLVPQQLVTDLADDAGLALSVLPAAMRLFRAACADGLAGHDLAALVTTVESAGAAA